ncbi:hypothetical protein BOTBODRAFT_175371 [Botryobasidium botryosum FD-172 SS1]|uniref:Uncharacterized protein n=1 Tax=Botryobasidium botryosum (strain FD-172 SS1) TaxID=930990 RepID=A0A067MD11_BOTB1|nr:hypothetical protein BOTBODRAFT_175371 [Botryobasidium botryosum FD-172 SS1]
MVAHSRISKRAAANDSENSLQPPAKKGRRKTMDFKDKLINYGKAYNRNGNMWVTPEQAIEAKLLFLEQEGLEDPSSPSSPTLDKDAKAAQDYLRSAYSHLKSTYPSLVEDMTRNEGAERDFMETKLEEGADRARMADTHAIRSAVLHNEIYSFEPLLCQIDKTQWGYHHVGTAHLLFPVVKDLSEANERDVHQIRAGMVQIGCGIFYNFMWEGYSPVDPKNHLKGAFRGQILLNAYFIIFFGLSTVTCPQNQLDSLRRGRKCNAARNGIKSVSMQAIVYVTTLVRFALSSDTSLSPGNPHIGNHGFSYSGFYRSLVNFLDGPNPSRVRQKFRAELLQWWNTKCFPKGTAYSDDDDTTVAATTADLFDEEEIEGEEEGSME